LNASAEAVICGVDAENAGPRWQDPLIGSSKSKGSFVAPHVAFDRTYVEQLLWSVHKEYADFANNVLATGI
jgi:hypothetical protein